MQCIYLNARSLVNKFDDFSALVSDLNPDIIGVTESWTNADINDAEILLPGYTLFRCDRPTDNKGGGVLLYVRSSLNPVCFIPKSKYPEHIWCKLNIAKNVELVVGVCYRSTNSEIFDYDSHSALCNLISEVSSKHVLLMGDFNYPSIDWIAHGVHSGGSVEAKQFMDQLDECFFTQHITSPTRQNTTLDLVITSEPDFVQDIAVGPPLATSDHNMITWNCIADVNHKTTQCTKLNYAKANFEEIKARLRATDWDTLLAGDIHHCWQRFKNIIFELERKYVPLSKSSKGIFKPIWMTNKVKKLVAKKRQVFKKYKSSSHPACVTINVKTSKAVKKAKRNFEKMLARNIKTDKKSFFCIRQKQMQS